MKLESVKIENFRGIEAMTLRPDPQLTVLHGDNASGKTAVLRAIAVGLGAIASMLPGVRSVAFRKRGDLRRGAKFMRVTLSSTDGVDWDRTQGTPIEQGMRLGALRKFMAGVTQADDASEARDLPIMSFYPTDRTVEAPRRRRGFPHEFSRYEALDGALSPSIDFRQFFKWFHEKQFEEMSEEREFRAGSDQVSNVASRQLRAVRNALSSAVGGICNPRIVTRPLRFAVTDTGSDVEQQRDLDELSDGYRAVLALVADLARRMAQGNPHLDDPLQSEAIVLIDEVDLHLHPKWQQRILQDLTRTFPNTQFIVSTHSPQVLTTVKPEHIVELTREEGGIVARQTNAATYGAEAGAVLDGVMGVDERPDNPFTQKLNEYRQLVRDGQGESERGLALRKELEALSPRDFALSRADLEIERRKLFQRMASGE